MNLFTTIADIIKENADTTIVIRKNTDGRLVVSVSYKNREVADPAKDIISPFVVSGTPEELDNEFVELIAEPMEQSADIQTSMANFEASKKIAQAKSQAAAEEKKKAEELKKAKKAKFEKLMAEGKKLAEAKKFGEAILVYTAALAYAEGGDIAKAKATIDACKKKDQPDIFSSMGFSDEKPETEEPTSEEADTEENEPNEEPSDEDEGQEINPLDY